MRRWTVYGLMATVIVADALFLWYIVSTAKYPFSPQVIFWPAAIAMMLVGFLPKVTMGVAPGTPSQVLDTMSHNFRIGQYRVAVKKNSFVVDSGSSHGVRIYARPVGSNSRVLVRSNPTPTGWSFLLILFVFSIGVGTMIYSVYLFVKSQRFGLETIPGMYRAPGELILKGRPSGTRACLIDTLSEGYRLSSEAYEAAKSNYEDNIIVGVVAGIASALAVFALSGVLISSGSVPGSSIVSFALGLIAGLAITVVYYILLRRRWKSRLAELNQWSQRLKSELAQEVSGGASVERQTSTFEVILAAAEQLPAWIQIRHKSGLYRDPVVWFAMVFLILYGFTTMVAAVMSFYFDDAVNTVLVLSSVSMLSIAVLLYYSWKRKETAEMGQISETWRLRTDAIRRKMEQILEGP